MVVGPRHFSDGNNKKRPPFSDFPLMAHHFRRAGLPVPCFPPVPPLLFCHVDLIQFLMFAIYGMAGIPLRYTDRSISEKPSRGNRRFHHCGDALRWDIPFWVSMPVGMFFAVVWSFIIGYPLFKLKGHYFAIATIATSLCKDLFDIWPFVGAAGAWKSLPSSIRRRISCGSFSRRTSTTITSSLFLFSGHCLHELVSQVTAGISTAMHQGQ